jgi:hypothetical protein
MMPIDDALLARLRAGLTACFKAALDAGAARERGAGRRGRRCAAS